MTATECNLIGILASRRVGVSCWREDCIDPEELDFYAALNGIHQLKRLVFVLDQEWFVKKGGFGTENWLTGWFETWSIEMILRKLSYRVCASFQTWNLRLCGDNWSSSRRSSWEKCSATRIHRCCWISGTSFYLLTRERQSCESFLLQCTISASSKPTGRILIDLFKKYQAIKAQ